MPRRLPRRLDPRPVGDSEEGRPGRSAILGNLPGQLQPARIRVEEVSRRIGTANADRGLIGQKPEAAFTLRQRDEFHGELVSPEAKEACTQDQNTKDFAQDRGDPLQECRVLFSVGEVANLNTMHCGNHVHRLLLDGVASLLDIHPALGDLVPATFAGQREDAAGILHDGLHRVAGLDQLLQDRAALGGEHLGG